MKTIEISSPAFLHLEAIPRKYTCDGLDVSIPLQWYGVPKDSRSLVLVIDDIDAPGGSFIHWLVYDISPEIDGFPELPKAIESLPGGAQQGANSANTRGYSGPCPSRGAHRYFIKLYALDTILKLGPGKSRKEIDLAMIGHSIGYGELVGIYGRE